MADRTGFIGAGNMATALIGGIVRSGLEAPDAIWASDISAQRRESVAGQYGIRVTADNAEVVRECQLVILAVKPQQFAEVAAPLAGLFREGRTALSIMAGVRIDAIAASLGGAPVIRVMPNLPALAGAGVSAVAPGAGVAPEVLDRAERILRTVGVTVRVPEELMDAVTGVSGCGPGFVYALVEAFTEAGIAAGLARETAETLAVHTFHGAVKLLVESGESATELRTRVSSPGGATLAGLAAMAEGGLSGVIRKGVLAARDRSAELGR